MPEQSIAVSTVNLLRDLSLGLQQAQLWSDTRPTAKAMSSTAPFACDSMEFQQWLQFIFIPKMHQLIEQQLPLPREIALLPMAEVAFCSSSGVDQILAVLARLDVLLGEPHR